MDSDSILNKIRLQNAARQKVYYEKNRQQINAKRRMIYANGIKKQQAELPPPAPVEPEPIQASNTKADFNKSKKITYDETMESLNHLIDVKGSLTIYEGSLKRLLKLTNCGDDLLKCFKNYKKVIDAIETSEYATNTKKTLYQMILKVIDTLHFPITPKIKEQYVDMFDEYKYISNENTQKKQEEQTVIPFSEYIDKVKKTFGIHSKMFLLANLYKEITVRDDFILKIVPTIKEAETDNEGKKVDDLNYVVINKKDEATLIINNYKTVKKYGQIKEKLSKYVSRLIRDYRQQENINYGDYLFGKSKLSSYLSDSNKKMGILGGGVNVIRQLSVSDSSAKNASPKERVALAKKMKHSITTQAKYVRKQDKK